MLEMFKEHFEVARSKVIDPSSRILSLVTAVGPPHTSYNPHLDPPPVLCLVASAVLFCAHVEMRLGKAYQVVP